ncbi:MAG TPA: response regulator, partial [Chroococcales cyanobacterium]
MGSEKQVNVLLVDDRPENLLVLRSTLARLGENLVEARSGREALERTAESEFAVILLDVMMPDLDGFETARLIREQEKSRHTPIIFVTAMYLNDSDAFRGYAVGAVDYIMKPFVPDILRSKVSVFVELFKKTEEIRQAQEQIRLLEQREYLDKLLTMEEKLREEEQRRRAESAAVRSVFEHAPVGLARLNTNLEIVDVNQVFVEQFSLEADVVGASLSDKLPGLPEPVVEAIKEMRPYRQESLYIGKSDKGDIDRYCDLAVWPTEAQEGEHTGSILVASEVTERMLRDLQKKDFVATLAHDLQTPVIASDRALSLLL